MKIKVIIDKFLDGREFRNYSSSWLEKLGFEKIKIEDPRLSDNDPRNDNDIYAKKDGKEYTIQTFLNRELTQKEIDETIEDMKKEKVENGVIVTNMEVSKEFKS
jgi:hypothetical protein